MSILKWPVRIRKAGNKAINFLLNHTALVLGGYAFTRSICRDPRTHLFYYMRHVRRLPLSAPIHSRSRKLTIIFFLMSGIEFSPGPHTPRYPCGVCTRAVRDIGRRALACDECDKWWHMSCFSMNTPGFDMYANSDLPWYCPSCNSLNRPTVVYDLPQADVDSQSLNSDTCHSSQNSSGLINSSLSEVSHDHSSLRHLSSDQDSSISSLEVLQWPLHQNRSVTQEGIYARASPFGFSALISREPGKKVKT